MEDVVVEDVQQDRTEDQPAELVEEIDESLIEEISIDGMCGVY